MNSGFSNDGRLRSAPRQGPATGRTIDRPLRLDDLDRRLLALLQREGRATSVELARRLGLSPPGLQRRLRRLEAEGVIRGYAALVDREAVGLDLLCFVEVKLA
ncbi:MAG: winged helix-turn-helix transcriptional regulator, partial [Acidobacteria bacterium]|nr:winged helix-turn-helix transcriptional regulator [Acidobacteriota bacterium]